MVGLVVIDASALAPLFLPDESDVYSWRVIDSAAHGVILLASTLCLMEIGNILVQCERRKRISNAVVEGALRRISQLPIEFLDDVNTGNLESIQKLAANHGLSFYDATHLFLAKTQLAKIATLDKALSLAAKAEGVQIA